MVEDFSVFDGLGFTVAFENMDNRKESYRRPEDFEKLLSRNEKFRAVLDVNHIYTNDPSMKLAGLFYEKIGDKIAQIHLSGYAQLHDPLFQTKQKKIIESIQDFTVPIIIESTLESKDLENERDYILEVISGLGKSAV